MIDLRLYLAHLLEESGPESLAATCTSTVASFKLMSPTLIARRGGGHVTYAADCGNMVQFLQYIQFCDINRVEQAARKQDFTLTNLLV